MNRSAARRSHAAGGFPRAVDDIVVARDDAPRERIEMSQLRVLCLGMAGLIAADALVLIYFWAI